ncbi:MAG: 16S rRNA (cytosine(1402)-N(4))-methyltransferase RsmH [Nitrospirae bacterium]|nr:16S rRNA (cytosine(1402)-N(4))-methyltransferase RsmH [Nitrospirota bacterium]
MEHLSVLKNDVQKYLNLKGGEVVVDATLGLGGHSKDILKSIGEDGRLIAFEQDERNLEEAKKRLESYKKQIDYIYDNFRHLKSRITSRGVDAILFDLGLSSPHVDDASRGFSFSKEGPLDMRFNSQGELTAEKVINTYSEEELIKIFFEYGEEKMSRKVAREICSRRSDKKFSTTTEFADFLEAILPRKRSKRASKTHPATKIFQALRIEVNDELNALKEALEQSIEVMKVGGRVVVISYHSLEDRIVKKFFKELEKPPATKEQSIYQTFGDPIVKKLTKKPVIPTDQEIEENPRSRSAKLRAYEKLRNA